MHLFSILIMNYYSDNELPRFQNIYAGYNDSLYHVMILIWKESSVYTKQTRFTGISLMEFIFWNAEWRQKKIQAIWIIRQ